MSGLPSVKDFVDAMSVGWPIALSTAIGSVAILAAQHAGVPYVVGLPWWASATLFIVACFSAGICITELLRLCWRVAQYWRASRDAQSKKARRLKWLADLPPHEHQIMAYFFSHNTQVFPATYAHERLVGLVQKGLILVQPGQHSILEWPHTIPDYVWDAMTEQHDNFTIDVQRARNPLSLF